MIHDVSTDTDDPPQFIALREVRLKCRNGVEYSGLRGAEHARHFPDIKPAIYEEAPDATFTKALTVAGGLGWNIASASDGRIEATATTRLMRFKDDVVICIRNIRHHGANGDGSRLDIRSASRIGSSDFGANARRIRTFLYELNNRLKTNT
jgi:uncharacterized protein (DUF1499 family)